MSDVDSLVAELKRSRRRTANNPHVYFIRVDDGIRQAEDYLYRHSYLEPTEARGVEITNDRIKRSRSVEKNELLRSLTLDYTTNPLLLNGSGDYHHFTYAFCRNLADRRATEYSVLDFDKHLDYSGFAIRLTCGNFNYAIIRDSPFVYDIVIISDDSSMHKYSKDAGHVSLKRITTQNASMNERIKNIIKELDSPYVYVTLDLDCLRGGISTDYGNGSLDINFILRTIADVSDRKQIIGMDICGLRSHGVNEQSLRTFAQIFELVSTMGYSSTLTPYEKAIEEELKKLSGANQN